MKLCKWHTACFKPTIHNFVSSSVLDSIDVESDVIYPWTMVVLKLNTAQFLQLSIATDNLDMLFSTFVDTLPDRHSRCPETISAKVPIGRLLNRLRKATFFDMRRKPVDISILLEHLLTLAINIHKPARVRTVHEFRSTAMTVRVAVTNIVDLPHCSALVKCLSDRFIYRPNVLAFPFSLCVIAVFVDDMDNRNFFTLCHSKIFLAIGWCNMDDARTIISTHIVCMPNFVGVRTTIFTQ